MIGEVFWVNGRKLDADAVRTYPRDFERFGDQ
jgi:hypothetical protein